MNINVQKVKWVIIRDENGTILTKFKLGMLGTETAPDKSINLIVQHAKKD